MKNLLFTLLCLTFGTIMFGQVKKTCSSYKNGYFEYAGKHNNSVVLREKKLQIGYDKNTNSWVITSVKWLSNCKYSLEYVGTNYENLKSYIGTKAIVIIDTIDNKGYSYQAVFSKTGKEYNGRMVKIKKQSVDKEIRKEIRKKIKKKLKSVKNTKGYGWSKFENNDFKIKYPSNWEVGDFLQAESTKTPFTCQLIDTVSDQHLFFAITVDDYSSTDVTFDEMTKFRIEKLKFVENFKQISSSQIQFKTMKAWNLTYTYTNNGIKYLHRQVWFFKNQQFYALLAFGEFEKFNKNIATYDFMFNSIKFQK